MTLELDLLEEPTVEEAHPETDDLDSLLAEAVTLADARKAVKQGATRKQKIDPILAQIAQAAEAARTWVAEYAVARYIETHCDCGSSHRRFDGWFVVSTHKTDTYARRFTRTDSHHDLPAWQYTVQEEAPFCEDCLSVSSLPHATIDLLTGIDALGSPADCCCPQCEQEVLPLEEEYLDDAEDKAIWEEIENA